MIRLLLLLSVCACTPTTMSLPTRPEATAAIAGWSETGLPVYTRGRGGCLVEDFRVRMPELGEFSLACGAHAAGCLKWEYSPHIIQAVRYPVVVVGPSWRSDRRLVVHELMHALYHCSLGSGDSSHRDPRVWTIAGGASSAESLAAGKL